MGAVMVPTWAGVGVTASTIAGRLLASAEQDGWFDDLFDRDTVGKSSGLQQQMSTLPVLMHFNRPNFTVADMEVWNGMRIHPQHGSKAIFSNGDFASTGTLTMKSSKNGTAHGDLTISMSKNGRERFEHGRWISVDGSEGSKADNETIKAFDKLVEDLTGAGGEITLHMLRLFEDLTDMVADEVLE